MFLTGMLPHRTRLPGEPVMVMAVLDAASLLPLPDLEGKSFADKTSRVGNGLPWRKRVYVMYVYECTQEKIPGRVHAAA